MTKKVVNMQDFKDKKYGVDPVDELFESMYKAFKFRQTIDAIEEGRIKAIDAEVSERIRKAGKRREVINSVVIGSVIGVAGFVAYRKLKED